jgi:hypothetical protein
MLLWQEELIKAAVGVKPGANHWLCGRLYRPTGTSSATVPPGARNLIGITLGSLMISQP